MSIVEPCGRRAELGARIGHAGCVQL